MRPPGPAISGAAASCPALPLVIGHRGAAARAPENTLAGFRRARALGCDWVEFDIRLTADRVPVICHDDKLERTTDRRGRISAMDYAALRGVDAGAPFDVSFRGERIPNLTDILSLARELGFGANIEIKAEPGLEEPTAQAVAQCLAEHGGRLPPVLVSSFLPVALAAMRDLAPAVPRGLLLRQLAPEWRALACTLDCQTIHVDHKRLRPDAAATVREAGYPLLAYTVNDPARAQLLLGWGVTSVFSDVPEIILAMLTQHQPMLRLAAQPETVS